MSAPYCGNQNQDGIGGSEDEPPDDLFDVPGMSYPDDDSGTEPWGPAGEADV